MSTKRPTRPKPKWLKRRLPTGPAYDQVRSMIKDASLHTVCQEAQCPNQWECFSRHTATFLILGDRCTRNCGFCAVAHGPEAPPDPDEPRRVADTVARMNLRYAVITSVTRDDLDDGGAAVFAATINEIHRRVPGTRVEVLIPDFQGNADALSTVLAARPDVLNHNMETVERLYPRVRPMADYRRSLQLLQSARRYAPDIPTKSGLMLGLGETRSEIVDTLRDLRAVDCRLLTLGQYLQPTRRHLPVADYIPPDIFDALREDALALGFDRVASAPFVRSSYHAGEMHDRLSV